MCNCEREETNEEEEEEMKLKRVRVGDHRRDSARFRCNVLIGFKGKKSTVCGKSNEEKWEMVSSRLNILRFVKLLEWSG